MSSIRKTKWENFILEISNLIFFWFFSVCFFLAFRIAFICIFFAETNWDSFLLNISQTLITGFRFDTMVVSYFVILPFLSTLITPIFNKIELAILLRKFFQFIFKIKVLYFFFTFLYLFCCFRFYFFCFF